MIEWLIIGIIFVIALYIVITYNTLIVLENRIENAWSQIDVQLKKRHDLIPNLVKTVKGYAAHEKSVFEKVTKARANAVNAGGVEAQAKAENAITGALKTLFAVAENYPDLKASSNFMMLQEELAGVENKVAYARQFYNDTTLKYNNKVEKLPSNVVAKIMKLDEKPYFEMRDMEKELPEIEF